MISDPVGLAHHLAGDPRRGGHLDEILDRDEDVALAVAFDADPLGGQPGRAGGAAAQARGRPPGPASSRRWSSRRTARSSGSTRSGPRSAGSGRQLGQAGLPGRAVPPADVQPVDQPARRSSSRPSTSSSAFHRPRPSAPGRHAGGRRAPPAQVGGDHPARQLHALERGVRATATPARRRAPSSCAAGSISTRFAGSPAAIGRPWSVSPPIRAGCLRHHPGHPAPVQQARLHHGLR